RAARSRLVAVEQTRGVLLERAAVLETRQAVRRRGLLGDTDANRRTLVEGEREERRAQQEHERRRQLPEDDGLRGQKDRDHEDGARVADVVFEDLAQRVAGRT